MQWNLAVFSVTGMGSILSFLLGIDVNSILNAGQQGQNLTDRGVWIVLLIIIVVSFIAAQRNTEKEKAKLSESLREAREKLEKLTEANSLVIQGNALALQDVRRSLDSVAMELRQRG